MSALGTRGRGRDSEESSKSSRADARSDLLSFCSAPGLLLLDWRWGRREPANHEGQSAIRKRSAGG